MGKAIDRELLERLCRSPQQQVALIVTVDGDPQRYQNTVEAFGLRVKRTFLLTRQLALTGSACNFLALSRESWILKMEEDKPIQAMD